MKDGGASVLPIFPTPRLHGRFKTYNIDLFSTPGRTAARGKPYLSFSEFTRLLKGLHKREKISLILSGGDVLLDMEKRALLDNYIREASYLGFRRILLLTDGSKRIDFESLSGVVISMDSADFTAGNGKSSGFKERLRRIGDISCELRLLLLNVKDADEDALWRAAHLVRLSSRLQGIGFAAAASLPPGWLKATTSRLRRQGFPVFRMP